MDPLELDVGPDVEPAVLGGLHDGQVGVLQGDVLADDADAHGTGGGLDLGHQRLPLAQVGGGQVGELQDVADDPVEALLVERSEEHTSELQSLMRISYAVFCLKK